MVLFTKYNINNSLSLNVICKKKKLHEPHFPLFIYGHKIRIFCFMLFRVRKGMGVGVRSYRKGGLVTLCVPQNRRRKVVTLGPNETCW
jgi:hypothetical protein